LLVDTHCHLNFDWFDKDRELVINRALEVGVECIINPGLDLNSSRSAVSLAANYPQIYAAVGVHPNDSQTWQDGTLDALRELAAELNVVAIGEIGLDYYRDRASPDWQRRTFKHQLDLAAEVGLPVVIHTRDKNEQDRSASEDLLSILSEWVHNLRMQGSALTERPGVLHSYSSGVKYIERALDLGFYIGVSGPVTYKKAVELHQLVADTPLERLLVETDAPFLTPHPYRGKRNEPAYVRYVADKIAEIKNLSIEMVDRITSAGSKRLFHWQVTN